MRMRGTGGGINFSFPARRFRHVLFKVYEIAEESYITAQTATRLKTRGANKIWLGFSASVRMCRLATTCAHFDAKIRIRDREVLPGAQNVRNLQYKLALLYDDDDTLSENHAIVRVSPDGFRLKRVEVSPAVQLFSKTRSTSEIGHDVVLWSPHSQESGPDRRCVRLPYASQSARIHSTKLPLDAHSTEASSAVDAWVLLEPNKEGQTEGTGEESATTSRRGHTQGGVLRSVLSSSTRTFFTV